MKRIINNLIIFSLIVVIFSACQSASGYKNIDAKTAKEKIDNNEVVVLDVRTAEEFQAGHIPGALLMPLQTLENHLSELDREQPYLIVCRSGNRSATASNILINDGFQEVYNLEVGMNGWPYDTAK